MDVVPTVTLLPNETAKVYTPQFTSENTPMLRLWRGLKPLPTISSSLLLSVKAARRTISGLDSVTRHDEELDADTLRRFTPMSQGLSLLYGSKNLLCSQDAIDRALQNIDRVFRGELRVKYEDRLRRHLEEARQLTELFSKGLEDSDRPTKPYQLRQDALGSAYHRFTDVIEVVSPLRRTFSSEQLKEGLFAELAQIVTELFHLRASVAKWRDNPSQKLITKINDCCIRVEAIHTAFIRMKQNAQYECQLLGMEFFNRQGRAHVERC